MPTTFRASRVLPAKPERVWELLVEPTQFATWFGTDQVVVPLDTLEMDVRPGGMLRATMILPDGAGEVSWRGEYVELRAPERLSMRLSDQPDGDLGVPIEFLLTPVAEGTQISVVQDRGDFTDEQVARTVAGYGSFFATMASMLSDRGSPQ